MSASDWRCLAWGGLLGAVTFAGVWVVAWVAAQ